MAVSARPKLLVLTSSFPRFQDDFAGCFVADFANALTPFFDITILTPASIDIDEVEDRNGIHIIRFNYWWPKRDQLLDAAADLQPLLQNSLKAKLQLPTFFLAFLQKAYLLAKDADIICSHWLIPGGLIGTIIGQWFNKPYIIIEHSGAFHLLRRLKLQWLMCAIIKRATRVVTVSKQLRDRLIEITSSHNIKLNKIDTIPMGVDLDAYKNLITDKVDNKNICQILFLGRLTKIKGVDLLLSALNQLGSENLAYQLIVAGDGSDRAALELYAQEHLLPVKFVGIVGGQEKISIINQSDIVVIPSIVLPDGRSEGLPVVCLEAFAAGKAVIAADVGGIRELIIDGENGYLFPAGDVAILRTRLIELIKDRDRCRVFGEHAAITVAQYHWPLLASRYRALFYSALWQSLDDKEHWVSEAAD